MHYTNILCAIELNQFLLTQVTHYMPNTKPIQGAIAFYKEGSGPTVTAVHSFRLLLNGTMSSLSDDCRVVGSDPSSCTLYPHTIFVHF